MDRRDLIPIGNILLLAGVYFFPGGYDIILKAMIDFAGGSYWLGTLYLYAATYSMIIGGIVISKPGVIRRLGGPIPFGILAIIGFLLIFLASGMVG